MDCNTPGFLVLHYPLEFTQTHVHWVDDAINHLVLCHPLLLQPSIFPGIGVFSCESTIHIRWPKYWHVSISISPSSEYSGLISFRMDWLDLLAVQGTLKSLLQHHSSKHQFFGAQPSLWSNSHIHTWLLEKFWAIPKDWFLPSFLFSSLPPFSFLFPISEKKDLIPYCKFWRLPDFHNNEVLSYNKRKWLRVFFWFCFLH